jgi:hypothetical protein
MSESLKPEKNLKSGHQLGLGLGLGLGFPMRTKVYCG